MSRMMLHGLGDCTPEHNCGCLTRTMTTPNGVPITVCAECHREHPQGKRHCEICGRPSAFINDNGRCLTPACREAKK